MVSVGADPLSVFLRIRPFSAKESSDDGNNISCIKVLNNSELITIPPLCSHAHKGLQKGVSDIQTLFSFTRIFDDNTGQKDFYDSAILDYIQDFLKGHNVLIFAYGVTNAGKTYTMAGTRSNPGVLPRALDSIFQAIEHQQPTNIFYKPRGFANTVRLDRESADHEAVKKRKFLSRKLTRHNLISDLSKLSDGTDSQTSTIFSTHPSDQEMGESLKSSRINPDPLDCSALEMEHNEASYSIWVSFVEIHNESIYDLLDGVNTHKTGSISKVPLKLADDQDGNVYIKDIIEIGCNTAMEALHLFLLGEQQRRVGETKLNLNSSRSHIIFSLRCIRIDESGTPTRVNTLSLVDLAGSERQIGTKAEGERLKEAGNINKSLLTLGRCIEIMRYNQNKTTSLKIVPFRETKLTRLFQSYLVGRSELGYEGKLTMIVNISQTANTFDETCHALKFSAVAREVIPVTIEVPRPTFQSASETTGFTSMLEKTLNEYSNNTTKDIEEMNGDEIKNYCGDLEKQNNNLIELVLKSKEECLEIENRLRKELCLQFANELNAIKQREANKQLKAKENLNLYHEARMDIVQRSIQKDRRLRMRRSHSVDSIEPIKTCINYSDAMDTTITGSVSEYVDTFSSTLHTMKKLDFDDTDLRLKYEENVKELARLQREKSKISQDFESAQDLLEDMQRDMRVMRSEYENKLMDSMQSAEDKVEVRREIARLSGELKMTLAQKEELYTFVKELEKQLADLQEQLLIKNSSKEDGDQERIQKMNNLNFADSAENSNMIVRLKELESENSRMKDQIKDYSIQISEKCTELVSMQTKLLELEESKLLTIESYQTDIKRLGEETRSLNDNLESTQKQNDTFVTKNTKLTNQLNKLKDKNIQNEELKDTKISELENKITEHKVTISDLKEQASSAEERLTELQAEQAARDGEAVYYQSKIRQLEEKYSPYEKQEDHINQLKSELIHTKKQLFEDRISYEKKIGQLEGEVKHLRFIPASMRSNDLPNYESIAPKSTRSSDRTYISMKDSDSPHYESIHSSMLQDVSHVTVLAPVTAQVPDVEDTVRLSEHKLNQNLSPTNSVKHTPNRTTVSGRDDSFDSYASWLPAISSEPIYENFGSLQDNSPDLVDPSFSTDDRVTHIVNIIQPSCKGKRKSLQDDTSNPPSKKRSKTGKLMKSSITKKRTSARNAKKEIKQEASTQVKLSPIPEGDTPRKGFQFFGTPSFKKSKKGSTPEERTTATTPLSIFSRDKSKLKSKKKLPKKSEISAPIELLQPALPAENPLRRLRPRK
ncbi:Kinesin-like protein KIF20A [Oopsacas minuta]|uniref:Kinesin-like protein KIF20A n=1 Tax=Oopsacas minuta TaxID=111878 RepID=A0AAV7K494_9METZ|nr:Kinesin-like protein KIF20A [Oopsacas minuta]